eukprot:6752660-Pyramimonas_sp.AAC.1
MGWGSVEWRAGGGQPRRLWARIHSPGARSASWEQFFLVVLLFVTFLCYLLTGPDEPVPRSVSNAQERKANNT